MALNTIINFILKLVGQTIDGFAAIAERKPASDTNEGQNLHNKSNDQNVAK